MTVRFSSRRAFLLGAGGVAVALPLLESLGTARADGHEVPHRFLTFFHPQGTIHDRWTPSGTGTGFELSPLLQPLQAVKDHINVVSGVDNVIAPQMYASNGHNRAGRTILTAQPFSNNVNADGSIRQSGQAGDGLANGPSLDQFLATRLGASTPWPTINFGIGGADVGENQMLFAGVDDPVDLEPDPVAAFDRFFSNIDQPEPTTLQRLRTRRSSVLDTVNENFKRLQTRVSAEDKQRLEAHAQKIRDLEERLSNTGQAGIGCAEPTVQLPAGYNPANSDFDDSSSRAFIDLMVMAMACDLARVGTLQYTQYQRPEFPWLGANIPGPYVNWHEMVHGAGGAQLDTVAVPMRWYMEELAYLVEQLQATPDGDGTLLDHTLVLSISEFGDGGEHQTRNLPIVLAGNLSGRLPTGRHVALSDATTGELFTSILQLFDVDEPCFGYAEACSGPAPLT